MPYVTQEQIHAAKNLDLLNYLLIFEPNEVVLLSGNVYTTKTHDSLKMSHGKWCWWSRGIGGRSALDYLIKVRGMAFPDAVNLINEQVAVTPPACSQKTVADATKLLRLPNRNDSNDRVISYLLGRGIDQTIIDSCIHTGRLYESIIHHNAVFIGYDRSGIPRYGSLRGTSGSRFIGDVEGSDKRYSFSIPAEDKSAKLHLFESAIDLLSFGTLELLAGRDWRQEHCLSLAGVYKPRQNIEESALPVALVQYLKEYSQIKAVSLHLDNDETGRLATRAILSRLMGSYIVENCPPYQGKDYNDLLLKMQPGVSVHTKQMTRQER